MNSGIPGAQSPLKAMRLLQLLTQHHTKGLSIAELTSLSGYDRTTTRRLLMVLVNTGYAAKNMESGKYQLGIEAMFMGVAALEQAPLLAQAKPLMERITQATGDTCFLSLRVGDLAYCLYVQEGLNPLPTHRALQGQAHLLGLGTSSLALAALLPDAHLQRIYQRRTLDYENAGITWERLKTMVNATRLHGFASSVNLLTMGATGVAVPVAIHEKNEISISVSNHNHKMHQDHRYEILRILKNEIHNAGMKIIKY